MSGTASAVLAISAHHARLGEAHVVGASCAAGRGPSRAIGWRVSAVCLTVCTVCRYARKRYGGMRRAQLGKAHKTATKAEARTRHREDDSKRQGARERYSIATGVLLLVCYSLQCTSFTVTFRDHHFGTIGTTTEVGYWGVGVHDFDLSPDCSAFALQLGEIGEWLPGVHIHWETLTF